MEQRERETAKRGKKGLGGLLITTQLIKLVEVLCVIRSGNIHMVIRVSVEVVRNVNPGDNSSWLRESKDPSKNIMRQVLLQRKIMCLDMIDKFVRNLRDKISL